MAANLDPSWQAILAPEFEKEYMQHLKAFLLQEKQQGYTIFPKNEEVFNAFNHTPFDQVKIVIIGQDPYHGTGQAHGLSFSVKKGVPIPPSLQNIYKELQTDIPGFAYPNHGELTYWADQGVLLLNASLTVRANQAGSHQHKGWEQFTDQAISSLSAKREGLVFMLWGRYAQQKENLIDTTKHIVLKAAHPSPFSAYNGFFGCKHFSQANAILAKEGKQAIDWQIR
jgi:uracil-DNA glycosylase